MKKIIIFGTGEFGNNIYKMYKDNHDVIYFADNDKKKHNKFVDGIEIVSAQNLKNLNYDEIVIASTYADEIYQQLTNDLDIQPLKIRKLYVNESNIQFYSDIKRERTEEFMFFMCALLQENDIPYYIDHGTLLGIVRDNHLIPWDKDVDLSLLSTDEDKIYELLDRSLKEYTHPDCIENNWRYKIARDKLNIDGKMMDIIIEIQIYNDSPHMSDSVALDLMFRYHINGKIHWKVAQKHLIVDYDVCFPLSTINFKNHKINAPHDTYKYLNILFGDWKTPVKEWSYEKYTNIENKMDI